MCSLPYYVVQDEQKKSQLTEAGLVSSNAVILCHGTYWGVFCVMFQFCLLR